MKADMTTQTKMCPLRAPLIQPTDGPIMRAAIEALMQAAIKFTRPSTHQLKSGCLNFYPEKGTIYRDGDPGALKERGLDTFVRLTKPVAKQRSKVSAPPHRLCRISEPQTTLPETMADWHDTPVTIDLSADPCGEIADFDERPSHIDLSEVPWN